MASETFVRVQCDDCGAVRVAWSELRLRMCADTGEWSYCFRCPGCGLATNQATLDFAAIDLLLAMGTPTQTWQLPDELTGPRVLAAPLTLDDLLDFHLLLEEPDWFASLASSTAAEVR
ncbi:MAG TPA: hypothetical protein VGP92_13220 [Acidimicrobiia bacterium]|nr:hypothetical protein [Acidimicrobiia bacterium]